MKNSLLLLSLFFAAGSVFSGNNAGSGLNAATEIAQSCVPNELDLPTYFNIDLGDGYFYTGSMIKTGPSGYSYLGILAKGNDIIGSASGSFQVEIVNGAEVMIESSLVETYSNDETEEALSTRRDGKPQHLQNVR
jgi:hypothetical protein